MNKELLNKYLNNNCTEQEFDDVVRWINENALDEESRAMNFELWNTIEEPKEKNNTELYNKLFDKIRQKIQPERSGKIIFLKQASTWLSRVAVILFIPLLGVVFYLLTARNFQNKELGALKVDSLEIISPIGSRTVVELSDGSVVYLNYGSSMKYPAIFSGKKREVNLSGEGYFKVAPNSDRPFTVKTGKLNITALGTEFNVCAYKGTGLISTTLVNGKVQLEKIVGGTELEKIGIMVPGQHVAYYPESEKMISGIGKVEKYIAWKEGKLVFDNDPILEVTEVLGRMFNVEFEVANEVKYLTYTVTFYNDPLSLVLELMAETTPVAYKILPRKRLPDGTISKQKIKIYKSKRSTT